MAHFGPFNLLKKIADGGMATTWLARLDQDSLGQEVALKRILPRLLEDRTFRELFIEESKLATSLDHDNVVKTWDVGVLGGEHYLAMEYIWGEDLRRIAERASAVGRNVSLNMAVHLASQVARALNYVHQHKNEDGEPMGLVHRDVSPPNVMLTYDGHVKLIDFGIARAQGHLMNVRQGQLKGKFAYMSPEQVQGLEIDGRSDLFSLGTILYELTTGRRLFRADSDVMTLRLVSDARVIAPHALRPDYPPSLEELVMKALAKEPRNRFATGDEFADALDKWLDENGGAPTTDSLGSWLRDLFPDHLAELHKLLEPGYSGPSSAPSLPLPKEEAKPEQTAPAEPEIEPHDLVEDEDITRDKRSGNIFYGVIATLVALAVAFLLFKTFSGDLANKGLQEIIEADRQLQAELEASRTEAEGPIVLPGRSLNITSEPSRAWIVVNGVATGQTTPATITVLEDRANRIEFFLNGYQTHYHLVDETDSSADLAVTLDKLEAPEGFEPPEVEEPEEGEEPAEPDTLPMAELRVLAEGSGVRLEGAVVYLNGLEQEERTPLSARVPAGTPLHVMITHPGQLDASATITPRHYLSERDLTEIVLELPPEEATAGKQIYRLDTVPATARVSDFDTDEDIPRVLTMREGEYRLLRVTYGDGEFEPALIPIRATTGSVRETIRLAPIVPARSALTINITPAETIIYGAQPQRGRSASELGRGSIEAREMDSGPWQITFSYRHDGQRWRDRLELNLIPDTHHILNFELGQGGAQQLAREAEPWEPEAQD